MLRRSFLKLCSFFPLALQKPEPLPLRMWTVTLRDAYWTGYYVCQSTTRPTVQLTEGTTAEIREVTGSTGEDGVTLYEVYGT